MMTPTQSPGLNLSLVNSSLRPPWILDIPESQRIPFIVCYALILILSVLGNTSIIAIVARNPSMRSTINYLIVNMAATDLASSVIITGRYFSVIDNRSMEWEVPGVFGDILCRFLPFLRNVSIAVSIYSMVAIAFDRFFAVVFPMKATPRVLGIRVLLPAIWMLSVGFFSVDLINYKLVSLPNVDRCLSSWPSSVDVLKAVLIYHGVFVTVFFLLPLLVVAILYSIIAFKIRKQIVPGQQTSATQSRRRQRNKKIINLAMAIVFAFFLCWSPYQILGIFDYFVWQGNVPRILGPHYFLISDIFIIVSHVYLIINPFICFAFSSNYRKCACGLFPWFIASRVGTLEGEPGPSVRNPLQQNTWMSDMI